MQFDVEEFKSLITNASNVAVVCSERGPDSVAGGIAVSKYLESSYNKKPTLLYTGDLSAVSKKIWDGYDILSDFNKRSLRVTLDYEGADISSVDYYTIENQSKFIIDINSVGYDFNIDRIKYDFVGDSFDLIFVVGSSTLSNLGYIYNENRDIFDHAKIINIDNSAGNSNFGAINIVDKEADSLIAVVLQMFLRLGFSVDKYISKILLLGLSE